MAQIPQNGMAAPVTAMEKTQKDDSLEQSAQVLSHDGENQRKTPDFIAYARLCATRMQNTGKYDAAHRLDKYVAKFIAFLGRNEIPFKDFDSLLMRNYHTWLENQKLGRNSVSLYIRNLKRIYRLAVKDGVTMERHPFEGMDVSYWAKKDKKGLELDDVRRLHDLDLSNQNRSVAFARDIFLFSVYTRGMRANDIFYLTLDNIKNGFLTYRQKTTDKEVSVPWESAMQEIVGRHARPDTPYLFPVITAEGAYEQWRQHGMALHNINRNLKTIARMLGIPFPLNMTVAHHTWESMTRNMSIRALL